MATGEWRWGCLKSGFFAHPHYDVFGFQKAPEVLRISELPETGFPCPGGMVA